MRMRSAMLIVAAWPILALAQGTADLSESEAAKLVRASPAIAGKAGRSFERVVEVRKLEDRGKTGWMVEFEWKEAGQVHKGVAPVIPSASVKADEKPFFSLNGWSMVAAIEDMGIQEVMATMRASRIGASEAAAIGDIRSVISGEMAYSMSNEGFYDELGCLVQPGTCLPSYPKSSPAFLDATALQAERSGYRRTFHAGPKAPRKAKSSPSSVTAYAITAVPLKPGETGNRGFCGDDSGRLCFTADGSLPKVVNGQCDPACMPLK